MNNETQLLEAGGRMAREAGNKVVEYSGSAAGNFFKAPFRLVSNVMSDIVSGLFSWTTPVTMAVTGLLVAYPDGIRGLGEAFGRTDISDKVGESLGNSSTGGLVAKVAGTGLAVSAGLGAVTGAAKSLMGTGPADEAPPTTGARIGSFLGTTATFAVVAAVAMGAIKTSDIAHDKDGDRDVTPPAPPKAPKSAAQAQA